MSLSTANDCNLTIIVTSCNEGVNNDGNNMTIVNDYTIAGKTSGLY